MQEKRFRFALVLHVINAFYRATIFRNLLLLIYGFMLSADTVIYSSSNPDISAQAKIAQVKIAAEKNELTLLYSALIKKNSCAKLIVLRCHYAHLSITITSKLSALNHKILYYCNCHATISSSVHTFAIFFVNCENKLSHYNVAATFDASLQVFCNAACVKKQHC